MLFFLQSAAEITISLVFMTVFLSSYSVLQLNFIIFCSVCLYRLKILFYFQLDHILGILFLCWRRSWVVYFALRSDNCFEYLIWKAYGSLMKIASIFSMIRFIFLMFLPDVFEVSPVVAPKFVWGLDIYWTILHFHPLCYYFLPLSYLSNGRKLNFCPSNCYLLLNYISY